MIYTVTLNPSLDYYANSPAIIKGGINKISSERFVCGGKGINVSIILSRFGIESVATGFLGGFTGDEIERKLTEEGVKTDFVRLENKTSRINFKLFGAKETEFNAEGPEVDSQEVQMLLSKLDNVTEEDIVVVSGSAPKGADNDIYAVMTEKCNEKGAKVFVDARRAYLTNAVEKRPYLIKPNEKELCEIVGKTSLTDEEIIKYARRLREMGAENVIVSLGEKGAVLVNGALRPIKAKAPIGEVKSTVGSGDSLLGGFIAGLKLYADEEKAFKLAVATGTATAFSEGLATKKMIDAVVTIMNI